MGRKLKGKPSHKSLKSTLQRHQVREKIRQLHKNKEQNKQQKKSQPNAKVRKNQELQKLNEASFSAFQKDETLLLVGEGDFSFTRSLIEEEFLKAENIIATSYDSSPSELELKYPHSFKENYDFLIQNKVKVMFKVDAMHLIKTLTLSKRNTWSKLLGSSWKYKSLQNIMFNFPHTGKGVKDQDRNIADHQQLIFGYFRSCKKLFELVNAPILEAKNSYDQGYTASEGKQDLTPEGYGNILLSVFTGEPYDSWMIKSLAKDNGLCVQRSHKFEWKNYPQYHHKRTNSEQETTKPAEERDARIYIFEKFERAKKAKSKDLSDEE